MKMWELFCERYMPQEPRKRKGRKGGEAIEVPTITLREVLDQLRKRVYAVLEAQMSFSGDIECFPLSNALLGLHERLLQGVIEIRTLFELNLKHDGDMNLIAQDYDCKRPAIYNTLSRYDIKAKEFRSRRKTNIDDLLQESCVAHTLLGRILDALQILEERHGIRS